MNQIHPEQKSFARGMETPTPTPRKKAAETDANHEQIEKYHHRLEQTLGESDVTLLLSVQN
jgi:hypothetical protein